MADKRKGDSVYCSFCGKPQSQVRRLVAGSGVYICDECVNLCLDIINDDIHDGAQTSEHRH